MGRFRLGKTKIVKIKMMRNPINVNFDCDEELKKFNEEDDSIDIDDSENVNGEGIHLKSIRK